MKRWGRGMRAACALLLAAALMATALADELILEEPEPAVEELPEVDLGEVLLPEDGPAETAEAPLPGPDAGALDPQAETQEADIGALPQIGAPELPPDGAIQPDDGAIQPDGAAEEVPEDPDARVMAPEPAGPARGVRLDAESLALGVGERRALLAECASSDGAPVTFRFASSNKKVAKVSAAGVVTAKKKGSATITVTASTGETAACAVKVLKAPKSIKLNAKSAVLGFDAESGAGMQFALQPKLSKKSASAVSYYGYDSRVVSVSAQGVVTAKGVGTTRITARTYNKKKAKIKITVLPAPKAFELDAGQPEICAREQRAAAVRLPKGTAASVRYASTDPAVAGVDPETGEITALSLGETRIVATAFNGVAASAPIRVVPGPDHIDLSERARTLGKKETFRLKAVPGRSDGAPTSAAVRYETSNKKVAVVYADGTVKGKKKGTAVITAIAPNGVKAECRVTVKKAPKSIRLSARKIWMEYDAASGLGAEYALSPRLSGGSASKISYSYDGAVVKVSPGGLVTAVGVGATTITARTYNGLKAKCKVTVRPYGVKESGYRAAHPLKVVAHRGGGGYWPENTLEAFSKAGSKGADGVELDVYTSKDGVQVIHHDKYFTANGRRYYIARCTLAELKKAKPELCTLDEALEVISAGGLDLWLEMKPNADAAACVKAVKRWGMAERTTYYSFYLDRLEGVRRADGSAKLGYLFASVPKDLSGIVSGLRLSGLGPGAGCVTRALLDEWHAAGLTVGVWTPNEIMQIKALRDMGVDVICTDYPDRADALR